MTVAAGPLPPVYSFVNRVRATSGSSIRTAPARIERYALAKLAAVASEVKALASQTARATQDIAGHIGAVTQAAEQVIAAIGGIDATIEKVNAVSSTIAGSVEQQRAATQDIAHNVQLAAGGAEEVTRNVGLIAQAIEKSRNVSFEVRNLVKELEREATQLNRDIDAYVAKARA